jgi:hypothetical protein
MAADPRRALGAREAELARALHDGPSPEGLDARMTGLARAGIARKRSRQIARAFPALRRDLGAGYHEAVAAHIAAHPPPEGGALADGLAFAAGLGREVHVSDDARVERALRAMSLRTRTGSWRRRVPRLTIAALADRPRGVLLLLYLPGVGIRLLTVRGLGRAHSRL